MKKQIRINFCNFSNMQAAAQELIKILEKHFIVIQDRENPQYVFYSVFDAWRGDGWGGRDFLEYPNSVRIFYTGENCCPDFNLCDYAIGFDHIAFFDRYVRFPLYFFYFKDLKHALNKHKDISPEILKSKSRFCNFIVSNHGLADPFREKAFRALNQYKHIDSAGGFLNNTGYKLTDKFAFQSECKFSLCFENSSHIGYITEKLIQAAAAKTIPIYWGDERACLPISKMGGGINKKAIVFVENLEQMVQEVQYLDNNDEAFLAKLREPLFLDSHHKDIFYDALEQFLKNICQQDFQNAFRRTLFGWNMYHTNYIKDMAYTYKKIQRLKLRIKNTLERLKIMRILEYLRVKITGK